MPALSDKVAQTRIKPVSDLEDIETKCTATAFRGGRADLEVTPSLQLLSEVLTGFCLESSFSYSREPL